MIELISLGFVVATFMVAVVGAWFAWRNHRARLRNELPEIFMDPLDQGLYPPDRKMILYFQLKTHYPNLGWRVTRVNVVEACPRECLLQGGTRQNEWRDFYEFDNPVETGQYGKLEVRPGRNDLVLRFLCERPGKRWWKKRTSDEKVGWTYPYILAGSANPKCLDRPH